MTHTPYFVPPMQACLAANDYQQRRCTREVQELVECCKYMSEANSVHCQGFGIIKQPPATPQQPAQTEGPVDATANGSIGSVGSSSTPAHAQPAASSHAPAVHDSQAFGTKSSGRSVAGRTEAGSDSNSSSRMGVAAGSSRQSSGSVHGRES